MNQNVSIKLSNNVIEALPGDRAEIAVTVTNGNGTVERFEIRVSDIDPTWYQLDWSEMLLYPDEPGNEGTVYLRLSIPPGTPTNSYMPAIEIYSESQQDVVARLPFSLSIVEPQSGGVEIEILPPAQRSSARMGRFQVRLKNGSSRPTSMRLSVRSANPTAQVRIVPPGLELPAMQQAAATLEIRSRDRNLIDRDRLFDFQLSIDNLGLDAGGQFVQTAAWGWLRRILITPFLLFMSIMLPVLVVVAIIAFLWPSAKSPNQTAIAARTAARCAVSDSALVPDIVMDDLNSTIVLTAPDQSRRTAITSADVTKLPGAFTSLISISPDGKQLAYVTADNLAMSNAIIWTTPAVANSKSVRLASVTSGFWPSRPVWSPDSKYLTYVKRTNGQLEMYAINLGETARPQTLLKTPSQLIPEAFYGDNTSGPLCWSRDGSKVIVASTQDTTQSEVSLPDNDLKTFPKPAAEPKTARLTESGQVYAPLAAGDIITPPLPPIGNTDCFVKTFSQNDPRWSDQAIKSKADYNGETLATNGCAIASAAMVLNTFQAGNGTDPGALNGCLAERAVPFNWQANLTDPTCSGGKIAAVERNDFSWAGLDVILGKGQPAIVGLLGGPTGLQFVVAVSGGDGIASTYRVNDPWDGSNYKSLQYFISKGYVPRWLINITPTDTPLCQSRLQSVNKAKPDFKLSATVPEDGKMYNDPSIIFSFQAEGNISTTAKLYTLMSNDPTTDGQAASPVTGQPSVTNFEEVKNGDTLAREGFYQLVIEAVSTDGTTSRLVRYFGLDRTPPTPKTVPLKNNVLDNTTVDGFQTAKGTVNLELSATDRLSRVALIEYQINGNGIWTPYSDDVAAKALKFDTDGTYIVSFRSKDGAGNISQSVDALRFRLQRATPGNSLTPGAATVAATTQLPQTDNANNTAAPANGNGGNGQATTAANSGGQGGANGGSATVTPTVTTPAAVASVLIANPPQLNFDATQDQNTVQLVNTGTGLINWTIQTPIGPAAGLLKLSQVAGVVPPAGNSQVPVALNSFNFGSAPITATIYVFYNNNTSSLAIPVTINPQSPPTAVFIAPVSGPLTNKSVPVKLQVTPTGAAKPNHATFSAKYADQLDGAPTDHPIAGQGTLVNGWATTWDISALPPQATVEVDAKICWTADETACTAVSPPLTGLSIPKPTATFALDPANDKLFGTVNINAQVTGTFDHITYQYTAKTPNGQSQTQVVPTKAIATQLTVPWDTGTIPPGSTVKLSALLCITTTEPGNCQTFVLPNNLSVDVPTVAMNPLADADAKNIPLALLLNGTVTKLNVPSGSSQAAVFVTIKFTNTATNAPLGDATTLQVSTSTFIGLVNGSGLWNTGNINTSAWKAGTTVSFTPEICWDGNVNGTNCFVSQTSVTGAIPDLVATLDPLQNPDFSKPVNLHVTLTQPTRINLTKLIVNFTKWNGTGPFDSQPIPMTGTPAAGFSFSFDSVALGLAPGAVNLKVVACNGDNCGPQSAAVAVQIPPTTLTQQPPGPLTAVGASVIVTPTLGGRGVSSLKLQSIYKDASPSFSTSAPVTHTIDPAVGPLGVGSQNPFTWLFNSTTNPVPPQPNITLDFLLCWGTQTGLAVAPLDSKCLEYNPPSTTVNIPDPQVVAVNTNGTRPFNTSDPNAVLPIPVKQNATAITLTLPITATLSTTTNISGIVWSLEISNTNNANVNVVSLGLAPVVNNVPTVSAILSLNNLNLVNGNTYTLVAYPQWGKNGVTIPYNTDPADIKRIKLAFVEVTPAFVMRSDNNPVTFKPAPDPNSNLNADQFVMVDKTTKLRLTLNNGASAINRVVFFAAGNGTSPQPIALSNGTIITGTNTANQWEVKWDHSLNRPRLDPQNKVTISWQVCSSDDDSNCMSLLTSGAASSVSGLVLGGLDLPRFIPVANSPGGGNQELFDPNGDGAATNDPGYNGNSQVVDYFNSSFSAQVVVPASNKAIQQIRFFAYPYTTNIGTLNTNTIVALTVLTSTVSYGSQSDLWTASVIWPDNDPNTANFRAQVIANGNNRVIIAAQYCLDPGAGLSRIDARCSDWSGQDTGNFFVTPPNHSTTVTGKQMLVINWQQYTSTPPGSLDTGTNPYDQWLQEDTLITRTLNIKITPLYLPVSITINKPEIRLYGINNFCNAAFSTNVSPLVPINDTFTPPPPSTSYVYANDVRVRALTLNTDGNNSRSICLGTTISFIASNPDGTTQTGVSSAVIPTHGKNANYSVVVAPTPTPTATSLAPSPTAANFAPTDPPTATAGPVTPSPVPLPTATPVPPPTSTSAPISPIPRPSPVNNPPTPEPGPSPAVGRPDPFAGVK